jgi:hypothetical protein
MEQGANRYTAFWDHQLFAGLLATLSLIVFVVFMFKRMKDKSYDKRTSTDWKYLIGFLFAALITFALFLRIKDFSLYAIIFKLPGFGAMRSLTRIINIELIFFALAASWGFIELKHRFKTHPNILFAILLALFVGDNFFKSSAIYKNEVAESTARTEVLKEKLANLPPNSIFSYEPEELESMSLHQQIDAMLVAKELHLRTVNGYSATSPPGYDGFWWKLDSDSRNAWLDTKKVSSDNIIIIK